MSDRQEERQSIYRGAMALDEARLQELRNLVSELLRRLEATGEAIKQLNEQDRELVRLREENAALRKLTDGSGPLVFRLGRIIQPIQTMGSDYGIPHVATLVAECLSEIEKARAAMQEKPCQS